MEEKEIYDYEISYLAREVNGSEAVIGALGRAKAEVGAEKLPERAALTYPVRHETAAYFGSVSFSAAPDAIARLTEELRHNHAIFRFLLTRREAPKAKTVAPSKLRIRASRPVGEKKQEPPPLTNEALEKKIEEILQE